MCQNVFTYWAKKTYFFRYQPLRNKISFSYLAFYVSKLLPGFPNYGTSSGTKTFRYRYGKFLQKLVIQLKTDFKIRDPNFLTCISTWHVWYVCVFLYFVWFLIKNLSSSLPDIYFQCHIFSQNWFTVFDESKSSVFSTLLLIIYSLLLIIS